MTRLLTKKTLLLASMAFAGLFAAIGSSTASAGPPTRFGSPGFAPSGFGPSGPASARIAPAGFAPMGGRPVRHGGIIDDCGPPPVCTYKTVIDWQIREVESIDYVTRRRPCGEIYQVEVVTTRLVKVPVKRLVKVCL